MQHIQHAPGKRMEFSEHFEKKRKGLACFIFQKGITRKSQHEMMWLSHGFLFSFIALQRHLLNRSSMQSITAKPFKKKKSCQYLSPARNSITALQLPIFQQHFATCTKYEKTSRFSSIEPAVRISQVTQELTWQNQTDSMVSQSNDPWSTLASLTDNMGLFGLFHLEGISQNSTYRLIAKSHMHCKHNLHSDIHMTTVKSSTSLEKLLLNKNYCILI